ncbi:MAG: Gfo/Idh/MocA family oxidoreductase [Caulobacteraceae bacterium]|nr:Gfo/Idh/MocA family oxidoreductase [Caulobacteraceae bacterium]
MTSTLRAGVIGAGVFGGFHAEKYAGLDDVTLTAVLDTHPERAEALAGRFGCRAPANLEAFLEAVDVISVAAPASAHGALALAVLRAGRHVYVEKPIATSLEEADAIVAEASARGLVAACGFLERAAFSAIGLFDIPRPPLRLEATRLGPPSPRGLDVSVVIDLMIHDLDLALSLTGAAPLTVEATGAGVIGPLFDEARAEVAFEDGFTAALSASRVAAARERTMRLIYTSGEVTIDFLAHAFENTTPFPLDRDFARTPAGADRLGASLAAFLATVRGEAPAPLADATDGAKALDLALAVERAVEDAAPPSPSWRGTT